MATAQWVSHPAYNVPVRYDVQAIPDTADGAVEATIRAMADYARSDARTPLIKNVARTLREHAPSDREYVDAVFARAKALIKYVPDKRLSGPLDLERGGDTVVEVLTRPYDVEYLAGVTGEQVQGDCDDFAMYIGALLLAGGMSPKFVTVAADPRAAGEWSHVYAVVYLGAGLATDGERIPLDGSHGPYAGWETNRVDRLKEWDVWSPELPTRELGLLVAFGLWRLFRGR